MYLKTAPSFADADCDVLIFINDAIRGLGQPFGPIEEALTAFEEVNPKFAEGCEIVPFPAHKCKRLVSFIAVNYIF